MPDHVRGKVLGWVLALLEGRTKDARPGACLTADQSRTQRADRFVVGMHPHSTLPNPPCFSKVAAIDCLLEHIDDRLGITSLTGIHPGATLGSSNTSLTAIVGIHPGDTAIVGLRISLGTGSALGSGSSLGSASSAIAAATATPGHCSRRRYAAPTALLAGFAQLD